MRLSFSEIEIGHNYVSPLHGLSLKITKEQLFSFSEKKVFYERPETPVALPVALKDKEKTKTENSDLKYGKLVGALRRNEYVKLKIRSENELKKILSFCCMLRIITTEVDISVTDFTGYCLAFYPKSEGYFCSTFHFDLWDEIDMHTFDLETGEFVI